MKRTILRVGTNTAACMLLLVMSVLSFNCIESPSEFVGPTYDTQLSLPVLDTTNYFSDFVQGNSLFPFDSANSTYSYIIPVDTEQKVAVGEFSVKGLSMSFKNNSAIGGIMNYEFTNRIPVAMSFEIRFLKSSSDGARSDTLFGITPDSLIKAANTNSGVITPRISNIPVVLTGTYVEMMTQADSILIKIYWHVGSELNTVKFRGSDYIRTRSSFSARFTINKP